MATEIDRLNELLRAKEEIPQTPDPLLTPELTPDQSERLSALVNKYLSVADLFSNSSWWIKIGDHHFLPQFALHDFIIVSGVNHSNMDSNNSASIVTHVFASIRRSGEDQSPTKLGHHHNLLDVETVFKFFDTLDNRNSKYYGAKKVARIKEKLPIDYSPEKYLEAYVNLHDGDIPEVIKKFAQGDNATTVISRIYGHFVDRLYNDVHGLVIPIKTDPQSNKNQEITHEKLVLIKWLTEKIMLAVLIENAYRFEEEVNPVTIAVTFENWLYSIAQELVNQSSGEIITISQLTSLTEKVEREILPPPASSSQAPDEDTSDDIDPEDFVYEP